MVNVRTKTAFVRRVLFSLLLLAGWGLGAWMLAARPGGLAARADGPAPQPPPEYRGPVERALFAAG